MSESVLLNPDMHPEISPSLRLDVAPELADQFGKTFGDMLDKYGKPATLIGVDGSFQSTGFVRKDGEGNSVHVVRNQETGELTASLMSVTDRGSKKEDIYRLTKDGVLSHEDPSRMIAQTGSFQVVEAGYDQHRQSEMLSRLIPPTSEVQTKMLTEFMANAFNFEKGQRHPVNRLRSLGRRALGSV